jgi:hypothetical protein
VTVPLSLDLPAVLMLQLAAYAEELSLTVEDAAARLIGEGLLRHRLAYPEAGDVPLELATQRMGEALAVAFVVSARDAMIAAAQSPEAKAIGWRGLALALTAWRGIPSPPLTAAELPAFLALDGLAPGEALKLEHAKLLAGWLERRTEEREALDDVEADALELRLEALGERVG